MDTEQIHVTGMSNGGMFIWSRIMDRLAEIVASAGESLLKVLYFSIVVEKLYLLLLKPSKSYTQRRFDTFPLIL